MNYQNGEVFMGHNTEFVVFNPLDIKKDTTVQKIYITKLLINNQKNKEFSLFSKELKLKPSDKTLNITFAHLSFKNSSSNQYAYQLEGFDEDWVVVDANNRKVTYTNLPSGQYTFKVKASNASGFWTRENLVLKIQVYPPFYKTWWFILLSILASGGLIAYTIYYIQKSRYQKKVKQLEMNEKINKERIRISRDLHDNVGSQLTYIINKLDIMEFQAAKSKQQKIEQNASSLSSFTRKTISQLRETIWAIHKSDRTLKDFINKVSQYIKEQLQESRTQWKIENHIEKEISFSPTITLHLFRIIQEATQNMIKYADASQFNIDFNMINNQLIIKIDDNGKGFDINTIKNGYGLNNMKARLDEIQGTINIESQINKGTTIKVSLPI